MMVLGEPVGDCEASHAPMAKHACSIPAAHGTSLPASTLALLTVSAATVAAGSYFTQPAASMIGHDLHLSPLFAGLLVTASQIGYVLGLLFLMPLGDLVENRNLLQVVESCAFIGEMQGAGGPVEQANADTRFQPGDRAADARRRKPQGFRRLHETPPFHHRGKHAYTRQQSPVESHADTKIRHE